MKVDLPQPESAATPMRVTFSPGFKASRDVEVEELVENVFNRVGDIVHEDADARRVAR